MRDFACYIGISRKRSILSLPSLLRYNQLCFIKIPIQQAVLDQLLMCSFRHNAPLVQNYDQFGRYDRAESVGDDKTCSAGTWQSMGI